MWRCARPAVEQGVTALDRHENLADQRRILDTSDDPQLSATRADRHAGKASCPTFQRKRRAGVSPSISGRNRWSPGGPMRWSGSPSPSWPEHPHVHPAVIARCSGRWKSIATGTVGARSASAKIRLVSLVLRRAVSAHSGHHETFSPGG